MRNDSIEFLKIVILRIFSSLGLDLFQISGGSNIQWITYRWAQICVGKDLYRMVVVSSSGDGEK